MSKEPPRTQVDQVGRDGRGSQVDRNAEVPRRGIVAGKAREQAIEIDMGIDIWEGCLLKPNDLPKLVDQYGGKISFMGGLDSDAIDKPDWTPESVKASVYEALDFMGDRKKFFIPCLTQGLPFSTFPGVLEEVSKCIAQYEEEHK